MATFEWTAIGSTEWTAIGSTATAFAVFVAAWQLHRGTLQAVTTFEDELSHEYRELARSIPVRALLGEELVGEEREAAFPILYQYIDLTNEQVFLRMNGRISKATWLNWQEGIQSNLGRPAFKDAWARVKNGATGSFTELRKFEVSSFQDDPRKWMPAWKRLWP